MEITGKTRLLGVIGDPVRHSLSPVMHNAALAELGADHLYVALPVAPENLAAAVVGFAAIGLGGFNITIPHKQTILPLLSRVTPEAQAVGAVNTVWRTEQGWAGTNTDVAGFIAPLQQLEIAPQRVVVLGNGGAARAVVAGCTQLGVAAIQVVGRSLQKLGAFQASWPVLSPPLTVHPWQQLEQLLPQADLVVNTTPVGLAPGQSPLSEAQLGLLPESAWVYDLIYTPTALVAAAARRGLRTQDGLEMLVQQGAAALEIWLQRPVPVGTMRQALERHLGRRQ